MALADDPSALDASELFDLEFETGDVLYGQGDQAGTIDLVSSGSVSVKLANIGSQGGIDDPGALASAGQPPRLIRRMTYHTVVGEMGFFRNVIRTAEIVAEEPVVVYTLTRANFERLQASSNPFPLPGNTLWHSPVARLYLGKNESRR